MDDFDKFLEAMSLDSDGIMVQWMSLSSLYHMLLAAVFGFLILSVYVMMSGREARDRNLFVVIPMITILMAVIMRIQGAQIVLFFGIFGILSIVRFRSELTDQKGITYILFAVIIGVLSGVGNTLLAFLAFVVVTTVILISSNVFRQRVHYRMVVEAKGKVLEIRKQLEDFLVSLGLRARHTSFNASQEFSSKINDWNQKCKLEYELSLEGLSQLQGVHEALFNQLREWEWEMDLKPSGEGG